MNQQCDNCQKVSILSMEIDEKEQTIKRLEEANDELLREVRRLRNVLREQSNG